jgi:hypothetical protein
MKNLFLAVALMLCVSTTVSLADEQSDAEAALATASINFDSAGMYQIDVGYHYDEVSDRRDEIQLWLIYSFWIMSTEDYDNLAAALLATNSDLGTGLTKFNDGKDKYATAGVHMTLANAYFDMFQYVDAKEHYDTANSLSLLSLVDCTAAYGYIDDAVPSLDIAWEIMQLYL